MCPYPLLHFVCRFLLFVAFYPFAFLFACICPLTPLCPSPSSGSPSSFTCLPAFLLTQFPSHLCLCWLPLLPFCLFICLAACIPFLFPLHAFLFLHASPLPVVATVQMVGFSSTFWLPTIPSATCSSYPIVTNYSCSFCFSPSSIPIPLHAFLGIFGFLPLLTSLWFGFNRMVPVVFLYICQFLLLPRTCLFTFVVGSCCSRDVYGLLLLVPFPFTTITFPGMRSLHSRLQPSRTHVPLLPHLVDITVPHLHYLPLPTPYGYTLTH